MSLFCLSKKVTKKRPRKKITSLFPDGSLIKLSYYCSFSIKALMLCVLNHVNLIILEIMVQTILFVTFLLVQKSNQKKTPEKDYIPFSGSFPD